MRKTLGALAASLAVGAPLVAEPVQYTFNGSATPDCCAYVFYSVGWEYTASTDFFLSAIHTRFGRGPNITTYLEREVTVQVRTGINGTILRSASFTSSSSADEWVGGSFDELSLLSGDRIFIQFLNVGRIGEDGWLGTNVVAQSSGSPFSGMYWSLYTSTITSSASGHDPIMRLTGTEATVVPEPVTMILLGTGLAGIGALRRRRRVLLEQG
jgi:hypothetical protein